MTTYGLTENGFVRKPFTQILADVGQRQKDKIAKTLKTDSEKTALGNVNNIVCDEISQCWEALEIVANGMDPANAVDYLLRGLAALTGVTARAPQKGSVPVTIVTSLAVSYPAGTMVANVEGLTSNQWTNREAFTVGAAGTYTGIPFVSVGTGPSYFANANTLNKISTPLVGWVSVNNPTDAVPGTNAETVEELRIRRDESLTVQGSATLRAVIADVEALGGIVTGKENVEDTFAGGLPPHCIQIIVHNDAASDAQIAQAIYDSKAAGIQTVGSSSSTVKDDTGATVLDPNGNPLLISFTRATPIAVGLVPTVVSANGFSVQAVKDALYAKRPTKIGQDIIVSKLISAVSDVDGIDDVTQIALSSSLGPPGLTNLAIPDDAIGIFDESNMTVLT